MKTLDSLVRMLMRGLLKVGAAFYGVKVYGWENIEKGRGAVVGVKHANSVDLPLMVHVLQGKATIFASSHIFRNPITSYLLDMAGTVPLYTAPDYRTLRLNGNVGSRKELIKGILERNGWIAYAPEGNVAKDAVRDEIYPQVLIKAAELGCNTYLVGIKYRNTYHQWFSFVRWPGQSGIEVRIEEYRAANKSLARVSNEMRHKLARLSGLELAVENVVEKAVI